MRVRAQDINGDYSFGRNQGNFLINSVQAVAQLVTTGLLLHQGEWFLDSTVGMPWETSVLGYGTASTYDLAIKSQILSTAGVQSISSYSSNLNTTTRALTVTATIVTNFGSTTITAVL